MTHEDTAGPASGAPAMRGRSHPALPRDGQEPARALDGPRTSSGGFVSSATKTAASVRGHLRNASGATTGLDDLRGAPCTR